MINTIPEKLNTPNIYESDLNMIEYRYFLSIPKQLQSAPSNCRFFITVILCICFGSSVREKLLIISTFLKNVFLHLNWWSNGVHRDLSPYIKPSTVVPAHTWAHALCSFHTQIPRGLLMEVTLRWDSTGAFTHSLYLQFHFMTINPPTVSLSLAHTHFFRHSATCLWLWLGWCWFLFSFIQLLEYRDCLC